MAIMGLYYERCYLEYRSHPPEGSLRLLMVSIAVILMGNWTLKELFSSINMMFLSHKLCSSKQARNHCRPAYHNSLGELANRSILVAPFPDSTPQLYITCTMYTVKKELSY